MLRKTYWTAGGLFEYEYSYKLDEIEEELEKPLKKVDELTKEYGLDDTVSLEFKKKVIDKIYDSAMKRGQFEWAAYFGKKYGL